MDVLAVLGIKRTPNQDLLEQIKQQKALAKQAKDEATNAIGELLRGSQTQAFNIPQLLSVANAVKQNVTSGVMNVPILRENIAVNQAKSQAKRNLDEQVAKSLQLMGVNSNFGAPITNQGQVIKQSSLTPEQQNYLANQGLMMAMGVSGGLKGGSATDDLAKVMATKRANNVLDDVANLSKPKINPLKQLTTGAQAPVSDIKPLKVYHGTDANFTEYKIGKNPSSGVENRAVFFTDSKDMAKTYGQNIKEALVDLKTPAEVDFNGRSTVFFDGKWRTPSQLSNRIAEINDDLAKHYDVGDDLLEELNQFGWEPSYADKIDGIVMKNVNDPGKYGDFLGDKTSTNYAVYDTKQIKPPQGVGEIVDPLAKFKTKDNLVKIDPILEIKKQVIARDIQGNKITLPAGEALTPYELKGNKYLLQDGAEYVVNKNQYQNIKGNAVKAEAQPFAPELEQTTETVKGENQAEKYLKSLKEKYKSDDLEGLITPAEQKKFNDLYSPEERPTKFSQYTLPGGENYREILIQAPEKTYTMADLKSLENKGWQFKQISDEIVEPTNPRGEMEARASIRRLVDGEKGSDFTSSHWSEPNVLAHVRLNERTYNNKPVTFLEEIQSDWAREARKHPVIKDEVLDWKKFPGTGYFTTAASDGREFWIKPEGNKYYVHIHNSLLGHTVSRSYHLVNSIDEAKNEVKLALNKNQTGTPTNPLLKNWQELAAKRALKDAVDNNSEYLAWTNGEQQAARYDLSKQVDNVEWLPDTSGDALIGKGGKVVSIRPNNGSSLSVLIDNNGTVKRVLDAAPNAWVGKPLTDVIGKGVAEKILGSNKGELKGEGLKIGGEWASNLYDRQLPNILEKLTGQKAEVVDMGLTTNKYRYKTLKSNGETFGLYESLEDAKEYIKNTPNLPKLKILRMETQPQMAIKLTPEVKARVKGEAPPVKQPKTPNPFLGLGGIGLGLYGLTQQKQQDQDLLRQYIGM